MPKLLEMRKPENRRANFNSLLEFLQGKTDLYTETTLHAYPRFLL